jgi:hypothetical protein
MTKDEALRLALEALELVSIEFVCNGAHHAKKDRHEWLDPCPIVDRYKEAITAIKAALEAPHELTVKEFNQMIEDDPHYHKWLKEREEREAKDEPVAWKLVPIEPTDEMLKAMDECSTEGYDERLYAGYAASVYMAAVDVAPTPPQRPWVGLTDEDFQPAVQKAMVYYGYKPEHSTITSGAGFYALVRAIEAKLRSKNENR